MSPNYYQGSLKELFVNNIALIDVRAPLEFEQNTFPQSCNLPLLNNQQRHEIGICYKHKGQAAAIDLGHKLVSGSDKEDKISAWIKQITEHPHSVLYCARGGLRSQISQSWIAENGKTIPIVEGGHKRLRNFLLTTLQDQISANSFLVISGNTGSGKTRLLSDLAREGQKTLDLEALANHRGSAFGKMLSPQPSQANFENNLAIQLLRLESCDTESILVEDESSNIGRLFVPRQLFEKQMASAIFVLRIPIEERIEFIQKDYVESVWPHIKVLENSHQAFFDFFKNSFDHIKKRLGGALHAECLNDLKNATDEFKKSGSLERHKEWISKLLVHYYDPLYENGLSKRKSFIVGEGNVSDLRQFLNSEKSSRHFEQEQNVALSKA